MDPAHGTVLDALRSLAGGAGSPLPEGLALWACLIVLLAVGVARWTARAQRRELGEAFRALSADALQRNNEGFLLLASERLRALQESASAELEGRQRAIEQTVGPLQRAVAEYQREARELERLRIDETGRLREQLRALALETSRLSTALRAPGARGRWGELTLRRTAELAGLSAHCDFAEQVTLTGRGGASRPDMIVRLPAGREIAVDAKAPLDAYLEAQQAPDEAARGALLSRYARSVRRHADALASREYASKLERTPEFVVMFLPGDVFLAAAIDGDQKLVEYALTRGVVIATPATLYALLAAVAQGWRQERLADNAQSILGLAREMDERLGSFAEHLGRLGGQLGRSVDQFNAAVASFDARVLPQARRIRDLGLDGRRDIAAPEAIEARPRERSPARGSAGPST